MFDDPHLVAGGGLVPTTLPNGAVTRLPILPLQLDDERPTQGGNLAGIGEHTRDILATLGVAADELDALLAAGVIREAAAP